MDKMKAILLTAGQGTRLKDLTKNTPKCLIEIGNKTILEHQIRSLKNYNIEDIYLVIGTKGEMWNQEAYDFINGICKDNNIKIIYNFDNDKSQNSYSLFLAMREIEKATFLAIDGDIFFSKRVLDLVCKTNYKITLISKKTDDLSEPGTRIVIDRSNKVVDIGMDIVPTKKFWYIYGGFIKVSSEYYERFKTTLSKEEYKPLGIDNPLKEFSKKFAIYSLDMKQEWININTPQNLKATKLMEKNLK